MVRKVEIFRAGKQTDSSGNERDWTVADLDKIASSYNPDFHEAPVCIGHPKDNAPAWAWVKKVAREGQSLFAEIGDEAPEFSDWLDKKRYKKRSISLYPDLKVRHLAFLGAQPPAVKGLADYQENGSRFFTFSDAAAPASYDFADWSTAWSFQSIGRLFQGLRDRILQDKDKETADLFLPQYEIDALKAMQADPEKSGLYQESEMTQQEHEAALAIEKAKTATAEAKATTFSEQLATAKGRVTALEGEVAGIKSAAQDKELNEFCESLVKAGKLLPADKAVTLVTMKALAKEVDTDFAEGDKTVKKAPLAMFQEKLKAGPKLIEFGETVTKTTALPAASDDRLTALTIEKAKANPGMSFNEAGRAVLGEHPELNTITVEA